MKIVINGDVVEIPSGGGSSGGVPVGTIVIWSGTASNIPDGWALCDGQDGRLDLRDKFVLGAGTAHAVGDTGGEETHTMTVEEMPSHRHNVALSNQQYRWTDEYTNGPLPVATGTASLDTTAVGGSQPHNNMPPYYALCYIIKTAEDSGGSSAGEVYSTEETRVGTWIDGKPLYRRTYILSVLCPGASEATILDNDLPAINVLAKIYGVVVFPTAITSYPSNKVAAYFRNDGKIMISNLNSAGNGATVKSCTIEYTKTTD